MSDNRTILIALCVFVAGMTAVGGSEHGSTVIAHADNPTDAFMCGAYDRDGKCGDCRACWDKNVKVVAYPAHGLSMMAKVRKMNEDLNANKNVWEILDGFVAHVINSFWRF